MHKILDLDGRFISRLHIDMPSRSVTIHIINDMNSDNYTIIKATGVRGYVYITSPSGVDFNTDPDDFIQIGEAVIMEDDFFNTNHSVIQKYVRHNMYIDVNSSSIYINAEFIHMNDQVIDMN